MPISRADVQHVARLARLALTDEELALVDEHGVHGTGLNL